MTEEVARKPRARAANAQKAEAKGALRINWRSRSFTVPANLDEYPIEFLEYSMDNQVLKATKVLLGDKQYEALRSDVHTVGDLNDFYRTAMETIGGNSGESSAS